MCFHPTIPGLCEHDSILGHLHAQTTFPSIRAGNLWFYCFIAITNKDKLLVDDFVLEPLVISSLPVVFTVLA